MKKLLLLTVLMVFYVCACSGGVMLGSDIERVLSKHEESLLAIDGVEGIGIQEIETGPVIVVYLRDEAARSHIPGELDGFPVLIEISEEFDILPAPGEEFDTLPALEDEFDEPDIDEMGDLFAPYPDGYSGEDMPKNDIERVLEKHEVRLMSIDGVNGVGIQTNDIGDDVIVVYLRDETFQGRIPDEIDGFPVVVEISGEFRALP